MSEENLEALLRANRAFNNGDLDRALEPFDPSVSYYEAPGNTLDTSEVLRGLAEIRDSLTAYIAEFENFRAEIDELVDAGDRVLCVQRWMGTGRSRGTPVEFQEVLVYTFAEGKITEGRVFPDRASAAAALGLD